MRRTFCFVMLIAVLSVFACKNQSKPSTTQPAAEQTKSEPDNNDLLQALQGKWVNETDSTYVLEIEENKMRYINKGQLRQESEIEVDASCNDTSCVVADSDDGWCFLEKGPQAFSCHRVLKCNPTELVYVAKGSEEQQLSFKKVK